MNGSAKISGRAMVFRAFLTQNFATGMSFGIFGISLIAMQNTFHTSRAVATICVSLVILAYGGFSPVVVALTERFTIRWTMMGGALLLATGSALVAATQHIAVALLAFGLFIGPGVALSGPLPSTMLASNWSGAHPGRNIGLVNMPILAVLVPFAAIGVIGRFGLRPLYLAITVAYLLLIPVILGVRDRPEGAAVSDSPVGHGLGGGGSRWAILARPDFWVMALGVGLLSATAVTIPVHLAPIVAERGIPLAQAAGLMAILAAASATGSLLFGWLCDRIGGAASMAVNALIFIAAFAALLWLPAKLPLLALVAAMVGLCTGGVYCSESVLARHIFGSRHFGMALGLMALLALPFTFTYPPLSGYLRDTTGAYTLALAGWIAGCMVVLACMAVLRGREIRAQREAAI